MDEEDKLRDVRDQDQEEQLQTPDTSRATDAAKKVGRKAAKTLRGIAGAGQTGAEATQAADAATEAASKSALKTASKVVQLALRAGGSGMGGWAMVIVVAIIFAMTFLMAILGGQQTTTATSIIPPVEEEPIGEGDDCSTLEIPGLTCAIDAPSRVDNNDTYNYRVYGSYEMPEGGREPRSLTLRLVIPSDKIEFTGILPGNPIELNEGSVTTYTWPLSDDENLSLFRLEEGSTPPKYVFDFSLTARPKRDDTIVTVEFLVE